jgi:hypothetical protein
MHHNSPLSHVQSTYSPTSSGSSTTLPHFNVYALRWAQLYFSFSGSFAESVCTPLGTPLGRPSPALLSHLWGFFTRLDSMLDFLCKTGQSLNPAMFLPQVLVNASTAILIRKRVHADPTYMGPTTDTCHMITPASLLEISTTFRARFNAIRLLPLAKSIITTFQVVTVFGTRQAFVELDMACAAYAIQTGRASERRAFSRRSVYNFAVWCWTKMELLRTRVNVC